MRTFLDDRVTLYAGCCSDIVRELASESVDSVVTDPPYVLASISKRFGADNASPTKHEVYARASAGFMGARWDHGAVAFNHEFWREVLRVLKPGGHVVAFGGTRTYHRLVCAIEDAGFEVRDQLAWIYGSGFPKSHDVSKGIDRAAGAEREVIGHDPSKARPNKENFAKRTDRQGAEATEATLAGWRDNGATITAPATAAACQWQGWGTALKPAWEPICLARKPLIGTVAENVLRYGTGALNIDGCRVEIDTAERQTIDNRSGADDGKRDGIYSDGVGARATGDKFKSHTLGRWPANLVHDGSDEVVGAFPETTSGTFSGHRNEPKTNGVYGSFTLRDERGHVGDSGSAARFFYSAKADSDDRLGSKHPTVKPVDLMQWLVRLVTPPGGLVLDPFAGTGTTGEAAFREGMRAVLVEREPEYLGYIERRMGLVLCGPVARQHATIRHGNKVEHPGPLFAAVSTHPQAAE